MILTHPFPILATPPLTPGRAGSFQAFWYFTLLAVAMAILVSVAAAWVVRGLRPMWRDGNRLLAATVAGGVGFFCVLVLSMILAALIGLTHNPTTPPGFQLGS
jgi:hypothetical protein